jgi:nucleotide-binding universal stress UspA family protein
MKPAKGDTDMIKTILVPLDGSDHAEKALLLACDIAAKYAARLVLLNVVPTTDWSETVSRLVESEHLAATEADVSAGITDNMSAEQIQQGMQAVANARENTRHLHSGLAALGHRILSAAAQKASELGVQNVDLLVEEGDAADTILACVPREEANLIVMGSRGLGDFRGLLLGSVSHKVSQLASCTCMTVR